MQQFTAAKRRIRLTGCDDLRMSAFIAGFPSFDETRDGAPQFSMTERFGDERELSAFMKAGSERSSCRRELPDGSHIFYSGSRRRSIFYRLQFNDDFSDNTLTVNSYAQSDILRYLCMAQCFSFHLLAHGGCTLHSAGLLLDGCGIALAGPSGIGKTTLALQLAACEPSLCNCNDDAPALLEEAGGYTMYGTPFNGEGTAFADAHAPLKAIVLLKQAAYNRLSVPPPRRTMFQLLSCMPRPVYHEAVNTLAVDRALHLSQAVPVYAFENTGTEEAAAYLLRELRAAHIL